MGKVVFTDTGGFTEAAYGDPVAQVADLKAINGGARPALQSSTALRPVYGRAPVGGRRNLFVDTSFQSYWQFFDIVNRVYGVEDRLGGNNAAEFDALPNQSPRLRHLTVSVKNGVDYRCSMEWKQVSGTPDVEVFGLGFSSAGPGRISVRHGDIIVEYSGTYACRDGVIDILDEGWKRLTFTFTPDGDGDQRIGVWFSSGDSVDYRLRVGRPQVEVGTVRTAFQQVRENGFDVIEDDTPSPAYLRFDLSDDKMVHTFPEGFTGDVMLFGRNGSWVEENVTIPPGGDLNIGPGGVNADASGKVSNPDGGIPGVLEAIGDVVGWLPVGRVLSESERQYMVQYYKERGAKGLLVPGPELVTNGDFSDGLNGWGFIDGGWDVINGRATIIDESSSSPSMVAGIPINETDTYIFSVQSSVQLRGVKLGNRFTGWATSRYKNGVHIGVSKRVGNHPRITPDFSYSGWSVGDWIDNVSVRELRPQEEW